MMNIKKWGVMILIILMALTSIGCDDNEKENTESTGNLATDQTMHFYVDNDPTILDPHIALDGNALAVTAWTFDSLVRKTSDGSYEPMLAESWTLSEDETVYTFTLREANWSDGTPIVAADYVNSWIRVLTPETAAGNSYLLFSIKNAMAFLSGEVGVEALGVKAIDDQTLEVTLNQATPYFLELLTQGAYSAMKTDFITEHGTNIGTDAATTISSGPFIIKEWKHEQEIVLERNPHYWDNDNIIIEKIEYLVVGDVNVLINMYEAGEIESVGIPGEFYEKYEDSPELNSAAINNLSYIVFNNQDAVMGNEKIRKALSYCFDRDTYYTLVDRTGLKPMRGFVPFDFVGKSDGQEFRAYNGDCFQDISGENQEIIDLAKTLFDEGLTEVGMTKEEFEDYFTLLLFTPSQQKTAQFIQQNWKKYLDVELTIEQLTIKVVIDRMFAADYTAIQIAYGSFYSDPMAYLEMHTSFYPQQASFFADAAFDEAMTLANESMGDERMNHLIAAESAMFDKMPVMPLANSVTNMAIKSYVQGYEAIPMAGFDFRKAYIVEHN